MKLLFLLFCFLFLALPVSSGLSSPQQERTFCKGGSCYFGKCPLPLVKVGRCFLFRSCCK
ncbi:GLL2 protein, partial [Psilopogon haemacephalus]|nr:GLL2 protein [Psilopogon haemacephalus]